MNRGSLHDTRPTRLLGEILVERGWISAEQLGKALEEQRSTKEFLGVLLLRKGYLTEKKLQSALSEQFQIPCVSLKDGYVDWDSVMKFSSALILEQKCFPFHEDDKSVTFAITNPLDAWAMAKAREEVRGRATKFALVPGEELEEILQRYRQQVNLRIRLKLKEKE